MTAHPQPSSNTTPPDGNVDERLPLTLAELHELNLLLEANIGIVFPPNQLEFVAGRLQPRLAELRFATSAQYIQMLRSSSSREVPVLAKLLANSETYFFRETNQFEALVEDGMKLLHSGSGGTPLLRILCAGVSSGEEVYTLRFFLHGTSVHVTGWDIDEDRVRIAEKAEYRVRSLRKMSDEQISRYLTQLGHDQFAVKARYKSNVTFAVHNILAPISPTRASQFDVIFCRNVLVYFSNQARERALEHFAELIRPGGLLFLGHSESIVDKPSAFEPIVFEKCIVYRRIDE